MQSLNSQCKIEPRQNTGRWRDYKLRIATVTTIKGGVIIKNVATFPILSLDIARGMRL